MVIAIFYIFLLGFLVLFGWLFGLDLNSFDSIWFYLLAILDLILSFSLSVFMILMLLKVLAPWRAKKPYDNMFNHNFANSLLELVMHIGRIKLDVTGKENFPDNNNFVMVGNHQENYDIIILMPTFKKYPLNFIAKEPLFKAPFIGKWIELLGNIPIGRDADRAAAVSIINGIKRYKEGMPMAIFPEGKRSRSNKMIDFKPGAFKLAMKPKADLLITTIYDVGTIFKKFPWKRYDVKVHIHPLIKYDEYKHMNTQELSAHVKGIIQQKLDEYEQAKLK